MPRRRSVSASRTLDTTVAFVGRIGASLRLPSRRRARKEQQTPIADPSVTLENASSATSTNSYAYFLNGGLALSPKLRSGISSQVQSPVESPMLMRKRRYVKEGGCQLTSLSSLVTHHRYMFLFNDLLLVAKQKGENAYKLKEKIALDKLWISSHSCPNSFLIGWPITNYVAYFRSEKEKTEWFDRLSACIKRKFTDKSTTITVAVKIDGRRQNIRKTVANSVKASELIGELIRDLDLPAKETYDLLFESGTAGLVPLHGIECVYGILMDHVSKSGQLLSEDQLAHLDTCPLIQCRLVLKTTTSHRHTPTTAAAIVNQFKRVLSRTESRRLFGRELEGSMPPQPVLTMIDHLMLHGTDIEGIFRKSPKQATVRTLRQQLEQGQVPDFHQFNIHAIASLLKEYLRNIPGHLLLSGNHHLWMEMSHESCPQKRLRSCKNLLQLLPPSHTVLLKKILKLLRRIAKNEESSKMTSKSLAVCIAPSLIDNPDMIEAATRIPDIVAFLIEHANELFPGLEQEENDESPALASRRLHISTDSGLSDVDIPSTSPDSALFDSPMSECSIDFDINDKMNVNEPQPTSEICIVELTGDLEDNDKTPVVSRENSNVKARYANNYQWRSHLSRRDSSPESQSRMPLDRNTSIDSIDSNVRFVRIEPCDSESNSQLTSPALSHRSHPTHSYLDDLRVSDIIICHKKKESTDSTKTLTTANNHGSRQLGSIRSPEPPRTQGPGLPRTPLQHYASIDRANRFPTYQEIVKFREGTSTTSSLDRARTNRVSDRGITSPIAQRAQKGTLERSKTVDHKIQPRPLAYSTPLATRPQSEIADRWSEERKALSRNDNNNNSTTTPLVRPRMTHKTGADPGLNMEQLEINWSVPHLRSIFQEKDSRPASIDTLYAAITPKVLT
uniref:Rho-GAP domain-containing protein n=1 Tax=Steinernema glaseri TaxID=37863 RepID=A0A1I8AM25_9BILA